MSIIVKTPPINAKIITTIPICVSVCIAALFVWYVQMPLLSMPLVLGIIAGGLVDLDNRLTGRIKNIVFSVCCFALSSLLVQATVGTGLPFIAAMTSLTFVFTLLGAVGLRYRTIAFGTLAVAIYTTLTYKADLAWFVNPLMILCGTVLYSTTTLLTHIIFPHRPVQENVANAYAALGGYFDAKAAFFDPDEADWLEQQQISLALKNAGVIDAFNQCRRALFYRMRGQHRHPRTTRMLRYYFAAQDVHERISSAHFDYRELAEKLKNTDLIFRIERLLELQAQACRDVAESLRNSKPYQYSDRLKRALHGSRQSLQHYAASHSHTDVHPLQRLLDNLSSVDYQLRHLENDNEELLAANSDRNRIAALEKSGLKHVWRTVRKQLNFNSVIFRHTIRLSIVVFIICMIVELLNLNLGYWILLTALFVCQPNYSTTKKRVNQRILGTVLGVVVGSLVPYFTPSMETKLWIVIVSTTLFFFFRTNKYSFSTFFITIQALTSLSLAGFDVYSAMPLRIIDTIIGASIAWVAVSFLWPDWRYLSLSRTAAQAVSSTAAYLREILDQLQHGSEDDIAYRVVRRQAHERASALSGTISDMSSEPDKYGAKLQDGFNLLKINYALIGYISALGAYRSHMQTADEPLFLQRFFATANHIANLLDNILALDNNAFTAQLADLQAELAEMRPEDNDAEQQHHVLWQQLVMIVRVLEPCHAALHRPDEPAPVSATI